MTRSAVGTDKRGPSRSRLLRMMRDHGWHYEADLLQDHFSGRSEADPNAVKRAAGVGYQVAVMSVGLAEVITMQTRVLQKVAAAWDQYLAEIEAGNQPDLPTLPRALFEEAHLAHTALATQRRVKINLGGRKKLRRTKEAGPTTKT